MDVFTTFDGVFHITKVLYDLVEPYFEAWGRSRGTIPAGLEDHFTPPPNGNSHTEALEDVGMCRNVSVESLPEAKPSEDRSSKESEGVKEELEGMKEESEGMKEESAGVKEDLEEVADLDGGKEESERGKEEVREEAWNSARLEKARKKRLNIVKELLDTERTYSSHIRVVAVEFYDVVLEFNRKSKQGIPKAALSQIFLNIRPIYSLSEKILQDIQQRFDAWSTEEALGDVISRLAPFLKLYSTYTSGFENAMKTLTEFSKKDRKFHVLVREFEKAKISTGLGLSSYMLEPVQRIPRYRLLLLDYLKYLPPDSPDKAATEKALRFISEAADLSNNRTKELEKSEELLGIQRSLTNYKEPLLVPSRSFIMKGMLLQSSRKSSVPRFFFLFSDVLIEAKAAKKKFKFKHDLLLHGMQVEDTGLSSFTLHTAAESLHLIASSEDEKFTWISALQNAISSVNARRKTLKQCPGLDEVEEPLN